MRITKFNEDNFSDEYVRVECRDLFKNLWSEKLQLGVISITGNHVINNFSLRVSIYEELNNKTYKIFNELFEFLDQLNMKFEINHEQWKIIIDIKNMDEFINEMKIRLNINKYNI